MASVGSLEYKSRHPQALPPILQPPVISQSSSSSLFNMGNKYVLVTGVSGFLGGHIAYQLLESGRCVRATSRSGKVAQVREAYAQYGDKYDVIVVDDFVNGDFSDALKDVEAVVHAAAPMPSGSIESAEQALDVAINGSLNIFRQAEQAGVKNFAYVSSIIAINMTGPPPWSDQSWNPVKKEDAMKATELFVIYAAEKTFAERAVWDFADKHPHVEMMTVNPGFLYGPFSPGYRNDNASEIGLSTNSYIYGLIHSDGHIAPNPSFADVRDVAKAIVIGLGAPPTAKVGRKRILITGEWFSAKDAVEYIARVRPELKDRLSKEALTAGPAPPTPIDNKRATEALGITEFTSWKDSVIAAVDDLLKLERDWKAKGLNLT
ncbi:unnamed protein product [Somion occarium]|uniref:NAD-dependent epimerase/dehydratase domain-containing protein n=1 Tax=Somion occarium TaxID=3059160 RepID=A0ABP1CK65_9APHY